MTKRKKTATPTGKRAPRKKAAAPPVPAAVAAAPAPSSTRWELLANAALEDLVRDGVPGYDPWVHAEGCWFDHAAARRALGWFPDMCRHVEGERAGHRFFLERWQAAIVAGLFGWKRHDGTRRYRECLLYVAKKNGKTLFAAGLALYMLTADGEGGAKVLCAASSRDQAAMVFEPCAGMVRRNLRLSGHLRIYGDKGGAQRRSIVVRRDPTASLLVLSADEDTADGKNPHCSLVDEVHRHVSPKLAGVLHKSSAARRQPLTVYMTTADVDRPSFCNELLRRAKAVRDNQGDPLRPGHEPAFLPVIYEADERDDWRQRATWAKANPNLGVSVQESFLAEEARKAARSQSDLADFLRYHCNVRVGAVSGWLSMPDWDQCGPESVRGPAPDPVHLAHAYQKLLAELRGQPCFGGLDLASTDDLTAFVLWFPQQAAALSWFWVPEVSAHQREERHHVPYAEWRRCGWVEATPGNACDYDFVVQRIAQIAREYSIQQVAFDRFGAAKHVQSMQSDGLKVLAFGQGFLSMSPPAKDIEIAVKKHRLNHGGHPVLRWCAGNAVVRRDPAGSIKPDKEKSFEKIDGVVALVMAYGASMMGAPPSVYESRGPIIL